MPFLLTHPAAAWLLPAVALPILFHLFFRLRRQVREFPSLMFFLRIDPKLSSKRKIHEWLVLLLRCLFLLLLILALMRPLLGLKSGGEHVARLVLIDNSGSMAGPATSGGPKLTLAERSTAKLIGATQSGDDIAVQFMVPDPTVALSRGFDGRATGFREAMAGLMPSDGGTSAPRAIRSALATLESARAPQKELHILTDLQRDNWSRGELENLAPGCRVIVHRIPSAPVTGGSVSLELKDIPNRALPVGRVTPVQMVLHNLGPLPAHVRLNSTDDSGRNNSRDVEIAPGTSTPAALTFSFANPGFHWAQVWIEGDAAPAGNRADLGFWCTDVQRMLFIGNQEDFAALPYAVSPGGTADLSGIQPVFVPIEQAAGALANKPLAVAITWNHWPQDSMTSQALEDYVRQGGTLFLVPAPDTNTAVLPPSAPWLEASLGSLQTVPAADTEPVILLRDGDAVWHDLRDADGHPQLGAIRAFQYRPLKLSAGWEALAASAKGATLLARRDLDRGRIFVSGLALAPSWSSLPLKPGFVVLVQNEVFGGQTESLPVQFLKAAGDFRFDFPGEDAVVKSLAGSALSWQGRPSDFAGFPRTGIYELRQRDRVTWVAVSANSDEAKPDYLPSGQIPLLHNLPHDVAALNSPDDILQSATTKASGTPLYRWLMLAALLLLLAETWLANERSSDLGRDLFGKLTSAPMKPEKQEAAKGRRQAVNNHQMAGRS